MLSNGHALPRDGLESSSTVRGTPGCCRTADVVERSPALAPLFPDAANRTEPLQMDVQPAYIRQQVRLYCEMRNSGQYPLQCRPTFLPVLDAAMYCGLCGIRASCCLPCPATDLATAA